VHNGRSGRDVNNAQPSQYKSTHNGKSGRNFNAVQPPQYNQTHTGKSGRDISAVHPLQSKIVHNGRSGRDISAVQPLHLNSVHNGKSGRDVSAVQPLQSKSSIVFASSPVSSQPRHIFSYDFIFIFHNYVILNQYDFSHFSISKKLENCFLKIPRYYTYDTMFIIMGVMDG
jgi:hypothetical protein